MSQIIYELLYLDYHEILEFDSELIELNLSLSSLSNQVQISQYLIQAIRKFNQIELESISNIINY